MQSRNFQGCAKVSIPTHYGCIVGDKKDGERFKTLLSTIAPEIKAELKL